MLTATIACIFLLLYVVMSGKKAELDAMGLSKENHRALLIAQALTELENVALFSFLQAAILHCAFGAPVLGDLAAASALFVTFSALCFFGRHIAPTEEKSTWVALVATMFAFFLSAMFGLTQLLPSSVQLVGWQRLGECTGLFLLYWAAGALIEYTVNGLKLVRWTVALARYLGWGKAEAMQALEVLRRVAAESGSDSYAASLLERAERAAARHDWPQVLYHAKQGKTASTYRTHRVSGLKPF